MITRKRYLGRLMSIMSLPTPQGRQKTQANHTCFLGILSSIDRQDKDISTQNNVTNLRQCTALLSCLGQDERWSAKNDWKVSSSRIMNYSGLDKLWYPISIRDTSTWSKSGAHGEHGDVFLFSNLGALWFSENRALVLGEFDIWIKIFIVCLFKGSQKQSFFLQTLLFTAFLVTVLKMLTYALVSTWSLVSSGYEHIPQLMQPCAIDESKFQIHAHSTTLLPDKLIRYSAVVH